MMRQFNITICIVLIIFIILLTGCSKTIVEEPSSSVCEGAEVENTEKDDEDNIFIIIDNDSWNIDYIRKAINESIEDNLPSNCEIQIHKLKRDINANWEYSLPKVQIESWLSDNPDADKTVIFYGISSTEDVCDFAAELMNDVRVVFVGNIYQELPYIECHYAIFSDAQYMAREQGRLIAQECRDKGGDILFAPLTAESVDFDEPSYTQIITMNEVLTNTDYNIDITFTYGNLYTEKYYEYYPVENETVNSEMTNNYLSEDKEIISIVGASHNSCRLWLDALAEEKYTSDPLIFGSTYRLSDINLIKDNNVALVSEPYVDYELIKAALECVARHDDIKENVREYIPVEILILNKENYEDHLAKYSHIYTE